MGNVKYVKVRLEDGTISNAILLATDAKNIIFDDDESLVSKLGGKAKRSIYKDDSIVFDGSKLAVTKEEDKDIPFLTLTENFDKIVVTGKDHLLRDSTYHMEGGSHKIAVTEDSQLSENGEGHAEGLYNSIADASHAEGYNNIAKGKSYTTGLGGNPQIAAINNEAITVSASVGEECSAISKSFVTGYQNYGSTGAFVNGEGINSLTGSVPLNSNDYLSNRFVSGKYNVDSLNSYKVIGGGADDSNRKNILTVDKDGNMTVPGTIRARGFYGETAAVDKSGNSISSYIRDLRIEEDNFIAEKGNSEEASYSISKNFEYKMPFLSTYKFSNQIWWLKNSDLIASIRIRNLIKTKNNAQIFCRLNVSPSTLAQKIKVIAKINNTEIIVYDDICAMLGMYKDIYFTFPIDINAKGESRVELRIMLNGGSLVLNHGELSVLCPNSRVLKEGGLQGEWLK